ncbi:MAG: alkaline phosphatase D family protein [Moraxellaceae bacterium]
MVQQDISLFPMLAAPGKIRVWLGLCTQGPAPAPLWLLNGQPVLAQVQRPLSPLRSGQRCVYSGIFEFDAAAVSGRAACRLRVSFADGGFQELETRPLPASVATAPFGEFNVLLVSCYDQSQDASGRIVDVLLRRGLRPDLTLLMGDQVYLDIPTQKNFPADSASLLRIFENNYWKNWTRFRQPDTRTGSAYGRLLAMAPWAAVPDDHEYWNNAPHCSPVVQNSWTQAGREAWKTAAEACLKAFQWPAQHLDGRAFQPGDALVFDIPPLSFFLADTRSQRSDATGNGSRSMSASAWQQFTAWQKHVQATGYYGVIASGQPLLDEAAGKIAGRVADYTLPNYGDWPRWSQALEDMAANNSPFLLLTGDVHYGRLSDVADRRQRSERAFLEVIASPMALVQSVGLDTWARLNPFRDRLWPRHDDPRPAPVLIGPHKALASTCCYGQKGDHVALLRFRHQAGRLDVSVEHHPLHPDQPGMAGSSRSFSLRPRV